MDRAFFVAVPVRKARSDRTLEADGGDEVLWARLEIAHLSREGCTMLRVRKITVAYGPGSVEVRAPKINVDPTKIFPSRLMQLF